MTAPERLRSRRAIKAVLSSGQTMHGPVAVVHALRGRRGRSRATVVAGRRLGPAVSRNRAKRRLRAALREADPPQGLDLVVVARPAALTEPFPQLVAGLRAALQRLDP